MIKKLGAFVFVAIGLALVVMGVVNGQVVAIEMGAFALGVVVVAVILIKIFPGYFDSEEKAKVGLQIIKKAVKGHNISDS